MIEDGSSVLRRTVILGGATGFALALVVSFGILAQRVSGTTATGALTANALTTCAALLAVLVTVRAFLTSFDRAAFGASARSQRVAGLVVMQAVGAVLGVLLIHAFVVRDAALHPWLRENPRQLVNDLVCVFGILAFVWGCAQKPIRTPILILGLGLVLGYELTAAYWHLDAPIPAAAGPVAQGLSWSVQRFVGSEVTASGLGLLAFRLLFAAEA